MVKIISQNVRGLQNKQKRKSLFYHLRQKVDILCLQETHSYRNSIQEWEFEWGNNRCIWSHGTTAARGVAILVNPKFALRIIDSFVDEEGRFCGLIFEESGQKFILLNLYAPNEDVPDFFVRPFEKLNCVQAKRIVVGDFNLTLDSCLDRSHVSGYHTDTPITIKAEAIP